MERLLRATRRAEDAHFWFRGLRRFARPLVSAALRDLPGARIIDCGCGTGGNLIWLASFGRTVGCDLTWPGLAAARDRRAGPVVQADVAAAPFRQGCADLVTSFDVLYALDERREGQAVAEMWRLLRPGGLVLVNVAALDMLRGPHSILSREVRRYDRRRLRALLEGAGFTIVRITYTNASIFPLVALRRLTERLLAKGGGSDIEGDITVPAAPLNALLSGLLAIEARLLRWVDMPVGSSLMCLARKDGEG